jgi:hypothetical protein
MRGQGIATAILWGVSAMADARRVHRRIDCRRACDENNIGKNGRSGGAADVFALRATMGTRPSTASPAEAVQVRRVVGGDGLEPPTLSV